jgi:hypothetical protein
MPTLPERNDLTVDQAVSWSGAHRDLCRLWGKDECPGIGHMAIPLISAILAVLFAIESGILKVAVFAVGAALSGLLHYRCLPLVPR